MEGKQESGEADYLTAGQADGRSGPPALMTSADKAQTGYRIEPMPYPVWNLSEEMYLSSASVGQQSMVSLLSPEAVYGFRIMTLSWFFASDSGSDCASVL